MNKSTIGNREGEYLGTILRLIAEKGEAKVSDIARELEVKSPSVTEMLKRLNAKGLIDYRKHQLVKLTEQGRIIAGGIEARNSDLESLLTILRVSEEEANRDACGMEHDLGEETMDQVRKFVEFMDLCPHEWKKQFQRYSDNGECP